MTCTTCGAALPDGAKFCGACGTTQPAIAEPAAYQAPPVYQEAPPAYQPPPQPVYQAPPQPVYQAPPPAPVEPPPKGIYAPISGLAYFGYFILFAIPIIGWILCIAFAFGKNGNVNRRGLARAMFVFLILGLILSIGITITGAVAYKNLEKGIGAENGIFSWAQEKIPGLSGLLPGGNPGEEGNNGFSFGSSGEDPQGSSGGREKSTQAPDPGGFGAGAVFSTQWPENEFTRQVPKPKFETSFGTSDEDICVIITSATKDQLKDYVKDLKRAGFTKDASTTDESVFGMSVYAYEASNGRGYKVQVSSSMGVAGAITIGKD